MSDENDLQKREFFVYVDENHENLQYPSADSEENVKMKETLIRQNVQENLQVLDGQLIQYIFENPKWTAEYLKNEKVKLKNEEILKNAQT